MNSVGYLRIATSDDDATPQKAALEAAGCTIIFQDVGGVGARASRPELGRALASLHQGDVFVVRRLDRLGRSLQHLVSTLTGLQNRAIGFRSLEDDINTTTPITRACTTRWLAALGRFEIDVTRERTGIGLATAAAKGRRGGRPRVLTQPKLQRALSLLDGKDLSIAEVAHIVKVSRSALYAAMAELRDRSASAIATKTARKRHG